ncbi:MAG: BON domain-containing protein [Acidobacteria bacterium]|nr:BON domain-containing protein [Acidobacteriota bacterium]
MNDLKLQDKVVEELESDPSVKARQVAVSVDGGVVTLMGTVGSYAEKLACEEAVKRVRGVRMVADEIAVEPGSLRRADSDIARAALTALASNVMVPMGRIRVTVYRGWLTLTGTVSWGFEREAAEDAVRYLAGEKGVINRLDVEQPVLGAGAIGAEVERALDRSAELDARDIEVAIGAGKVTLSGCVHSWRAKQEAERAAWAAPGVSAVDNGLSVAP